MFYVWGCGVPTWLLLRDDWGEEGMRVGSEVR